MRVQDADTTKLSRTGIRPDVAKGVAKLPSSLERRQGRRSRAPRAPRPVRRPSSWRPAGGLASDRIGDFAARIFSPRAPRPRLRPGVRQEEPRRAQAPSLALAVVPAPLVLGESCGSRCQPTAAARGKPMTSTNGSGGHGFVPPTKPIAKRAKQLRVQDADATRLSRAGIRPDVTMPNVSVRNGQSVLPSSLERRQGRRSRAPRAPRPVRRPSLAAGRRPRQRPHRRLRRPHLLSSGSSTSPAA